MPVQVYNASHLYVEKPPVAISKARLVTARYFEINAETVLVFKGWAMIFPH